MVYSQSSNDIKFLYLTYSQKSKSMVQCQTMNKQVEDSNTSNQNNLSHQNYYHQNNSHNQNDSPHQNPHLSHNDTHLSETSLNSITASREGPINSEWLGVLFNGFL